jgi:hypothetical protein
MRIWLDAGVVCSNGSNDIEPFCLESFDTESLLLLRHDRNHVVLAGLRSGVVRFSSAVGKGVDFVRGGSESSRVSSDLFTCSMGLRGSCALIMDSFYLVWSVCGRISKVCRN